MDMARAVVPGGPTGKLALQVRTRRLTHDRIVLGTFGSQFARALDRGFTSTAKKGKALRFEDEGEVVFVKRVHVGGRHFYAKWVAAAPKIIETCVASFRDIKARAEHSRDAADRQGAEGLMASYADRVPEPPGLPYEPASLTGYPCVTPLSRRFDPASRDRPARRHDHEWRLRLYNSCRTTKAQDAIDHLIPLILDVPRHHSTMEGAVDFSPSTTSARRSSSRRTTAGQLRLGCACRAEM